MNVHKRHLPRNFGLLYVFTVLIFLTNFYFMFCGFFGFLKIIAPGVGFEDDLFVSGVEVLHFICSRGDSLFQKTFSCVLPEERYGQAWN